MNERKLIDEIKRLVNDDVIIGYYNGTTFTDDNGRTYSNLVTNNSPIGRGFIVPYNNQWLVVVANNNQEVRKNIITSRRKISIEDKTKPIIDYLITETPRIRFIFDIASLYFSRGQYNNIIFPNIKKSLTGIYGDKIDTYVTTSDIFSRRWLNLMIPTSDDEIVIALIDEFNTLYYDNNLIFQSAIFNADRNDFESAYNLNPDRKFKGLIYTTFPPSSFLPLPSLLPSLFEEYNLSSYNLSYKLINEDRDVATVEQDLLEFITSNTFYTIRDNKWKKYELPETVVLKNLNYYIDSNYVVIKSDVDDENERFNQLTVLKDDVFTTYTYPEELPVLKTWRKDIYNTYNVMPFEITFESSDFYLVSTMSNSIGTGSKTFTYSSSSSNTNLERLVVGTRLRAVYDENNYMEGVVTAVSSTSVTITSDNAVGSGTYALWFIRINKSKYSNKLVTMQQNRLYKLITNLNDIIEALSLKKSINLDISKCRFTEDSITSCRKESKLKSPKLDTDIFFPEEIKRQTIVSTYIKYQ